MLDINGNKLNSGDILIEQNGKSFHFANGVSLTTYTYDIYQLGVISAFDGHGYIYNINGDKFSQSWHNPESSILVKNAPRYFKWAFRYGMRHIESKILSENIYEIIGNSDWAERYMELRIYQKSDYFKANHD